MIQTPTSISQLVADIKHCLEGQFRQVNVIGEVSNLSKSSAGHYYLSLSDEESTCQAALFRFDAMRNPFVRNLKNGDKVLCQGSIGVYAKRGTFQIIIKSIRPAGKGTLKEQFEALKEKLMGEGLFDQLHKRPIPKFPKKVAVVTAPQGAALQDFINVFKRRSMMMELVLVPAVVQGDASAASLIRALDKIEKVGGFDCVVLTRGGGSLEDLWSFNDEKLARKIFACPFPVISAVGHQVDFTISDFVADLRAETPTAAAELLTQGQDYFIERLSVAHERLIREMNYLLMGVRSRLREGHPKNILNLLTDNVLHYQKRLSELNISNRLYELTSIHEKHFQLDETLNFMRYHLESRVERERSRMQGFMQMLNALNPNQVLERGYTYLTDENGNVINKAEKFRKLPPKTNFLVQFSDGQERAQRSD